METIEVLAIGTQVVIDAEIPATIRAVTIYSDTWIKYLCVWWDERSRREEWLLAEEIKPQNGSRTMRIAMRPPIDALKPCDCPGRHA
jgi:hypothetical protein